MRKGQGFTLIELLIVIGIIGLLLTILMPSLGAARELARQSVCGSNLGNIGKGMALYTEKYKTYPRLNEWGQFTNWKTWVDDPDHMWTTPDFARCNAQNYWLLCYDKVIKEKAFRCPSDSDAKRYTPEKDRYGFKDRANISYGLQPTMSTDDYESRLGAPGQDESVIIAGDKPFYDGNSLKEHEGNGNHGEEGGNFLARAGSVDWNQNPENDIGWDSDNVYTETNDDDIHPNDSYLYWKKP